MATKRTRIYEVPTVNPAPTSPQSYLVEAKSGPAAYAHVAAKFVGEPTLPDGKRIATLMGAGAPVEEAKDPESTTGSGNAGATS